MYTTRTTRAVLILAVATVAACTRTAGGASTSTPDQAVAGLKWGPAPPILPPGAQLAVLQGDPSKAAPFTVRLRFPSGYRIAPHTHPTDEHVTVIEGTFLVGMGEKFVTNGMLALGPGGFVTAPANEAHYATARGTTVVQVHAIGPFALTYVNPADTPRAVGR